MGAVLGFTTSLYIGDRLPSSPIAPVIILAFFLVNFAGIVATCLQWTVLSIFIKRSFAWLITGLIGWCFPFAAILLLFVRHNRAIRRSYRGWWFDSWILAMAHHAKVGISCRLVDFSKHNWVVSCCDVTLSSYSFSASRPSWGYWSMLLFPFFPGVITGVTMMLLMKSAHLSPATSATLAFSCHHLVGHSRGTAGDKPEEGGDDVKSSWPLRAGLHTCYNGGDRGQLLQRV